MGLRGAFVIQARHRNRLPLPQPAVVHVRRSYAECRYGQIHLWTAYPSGGGFDEHVPLICLHNVGGSGRLFAPVLRELGHDRSVYAPDLPGHGTSDAPTSRYTVAEMAGAVGEFIDSLRLRSVDLFGYQLGAQLAAELAIARPQQIRRIVMWGIPAVTAQDRNGLPHPANLGARDDGSDVAEEWRRIVEQRGPGVPNSSLAEEFGDRLRAGSNVSRGYAAAIEYPASERLPLVKQPALVLRLRDEYSEHAARARAALPHGALTDVTDYGQGFINAAPQKFATVVKEFLDR
jgi:pimeloyl-ACP methyl ester carboxylesterase